MHIPRAIVDCSNSRFFRFAGDANIVDSKRHHSQYSPEFSLKNLEIVSHDSLAKDSNLLADALSHKLFVRLTGDENHHLLNVLRLGLGASVEIFYRPTSSVFCGTVSCISDGEIIILLDRQIETATVPNIHLLVGLIRPQKADVIVEQCAGLGVSSLVFFAAERSQNRGEFSAIEKRLERWTRIASAAALQSGFVGGELLLGCQRSLAAGIAYTCDVIGRSEQSETHNAHNVSTRFVFTGKLYGANTPRLIETPQVMGAIRSHLFPCQCSDFRGAEQHSHSTTDMFAADGCYNDHLSQQSTNRLNSAVALIGPEGGLTDKEIATAVSGGFVAVSLGCKTLRTEVAALLISGLLIELLSR